MFFVVAELECIVARTECGAEQTAREGRKPADFLAIDDFTAGNFFGKAASVRNT